MNELRSEYESTYLAYVNGSDYLSFEDWLNENKKDYMCVNCGGGFEEIFTDEERDADFCKDCYERNNK